VLETRSWGTWRNNPLQVRDINDRLMINERAFTEREGLSGRTWYKHLVTSFPEIYS
jgi:N-acetylated-alpha-linked acidic dipeptidase